MRTKNTPDQTASRPGHRRAKEATLPVAADAVVPAPAKPSKLERREKQRATNLLRAEKMHTARLAWEAQRGLELDPNPTPALPTLNIGCSGWFYWDWKGTFYPEGMPTSAWFAHYAAHFRTVELNAPFYGWPTPGTVKTWIRQAEEAPQGEGFVYTIKVSELITHIRQMKDVGELVRDFGFIADLLGDRFGCFLYQFPASHTYSAARLDDLMRQLDHGRRNVVEFRHASWWNDTVYAAFERHGTIFCACSGPRLPDDMVKTADEIYVRYHGLKDWYRYLYSEEEMQVWARRIADVEPTRIWAYFNNDYDGHALTNARQLRALLEPPALTQLAG